YELLTGNPPFGRERATQRQRHCEALPPLPRFDEASMSAALADLSISCLAKEASNRPESFKIIIQDLIGIGMHQAGETVLRLTSYVVEYDKLGEKLAAEMGSAPSAMLYESRVASLLEAGEPSAALEVVANVPVGSRSLNLLLATGTALSLSGQDEEA